MLCTLQYCRPEDALTGLQIKQHVAHYGNILMTDQQETILCCKPNKCDRHVHTKGGFRHKHRGHWLLNSPYPVCLLYF